MDIGYHSMATAIYVIRVIVQTWHTNINLLSLKWRSEERVALFCTLVIG